MVKKRTRDTSANQAVMRQNICDAALAIFRRQGYGAVSMRAVAVELGVSTMSTYNYFKGKDELFLEIRSRLFRQLTDYLNARSVSGDPSLGLEQTCRAYISYGVTHPAEYNLLFNAWDFEDFRAVISKFGPERLRDQAPWEVLTSHVEKYLSAEKIGTNPQKAAHLIWAQMHGLLSLHQAHKLVFGVTLQDLLPDCIETIFRGILARAPTSTPSAKRNEHAQLVIADEAMP
jgi:AcrR family transcriptional regulator